MLAHLVFFADYVVRRRLLYVNDRGVKLDVLIATGKFNRVRQEIQQDLEVPRLIALDGLEELPYFTLR